MLQGQVVTYAADNTDAATSSAGPYPFEQPARG